MSIDENLDEENFDKPAKKDSESKDVFKDEEKEDKSGEIVIDDSPEDKEDDVEVVISEEKPQEKEKQFGRSTESRFGKRKNRFKNRGRDSEYVRNLESTVNDLKGKFDTVAKRLEDVESATTRTSDANVDSQIGEAQRYYDQALHAHSLAVKEGDGEQATKALDIMMEARDALTLLKQSKSSRGTTERTTTTRDTTMPKTDPAVLRMFDRWNANNTWFDPSLRDQVSRVAFRIDNTLTAEGFDPRTQEYWEELDSRLKENKYIREAGVLDDYDDEEETQTTKKGDSKEVTRRPAPQTDRTPQGGSNNNGKRRIVVSKQRADAMREMGLQPGTKEWNNMAKKFSGWDKQHANA